VIRVICDWIGATVNISDAQRDVRTVFLGGFAGQLVSGAVRFVSAALATWHSSRTAIYALVVGGLFIFPLTQLLLRMMGRPIALPKGHPMNALGIRRIGLSPDRSGRGRDDHR
jgi:hypothetical protein